MFIYLCNFLIWAKDVTVSVWNLKKNNDPIRGRKLFKGINYMRRYSKLVFPSQNCSHGYVNTISNTRSTQILLYKITAMFNANCMMRIHSREVSNSAICNSNIFLPFAFVATNVRLIFVHLFRPLTFILDSKINVYICSTLYCMP